MSENFKSRREFLEWAVATFGVVGALNVIPAMAASTSLPAGKTAVAANDKAAEQLGYVADASKADTKKFPQLKSVEGKKQKCDNCMFYTKANDSWGQCQVIQSGLVNAKGWCMSWAKRP